MKIVYVCERAYNLYRALLKAINSNDKPDIVLTDNTDGMELMLNELRKSELFNNVFFFNDLKHETFTHPLEADNAFSVKNINYIIKSIKNLFHITIGFFEYLKSQHKAKFIKLPDGLDFNKYDEIHITDCTSMMNFYLYRNKYDNLIYVEHAKNTLQNNYWKITNFLLVLAKLRIIYGIRGSCRYIRAIEVSEDKNLIKDTRGKEIREVPVDKLRDSLTPEQAEFIYQIYAKSYNLVFPEDSTIDLFLTTTISGETDSAAHLRLCKEVISRYMSGADSIIIKPHPFDRTDYSEMLEIYPNAIIMPSCFSAEIFALSSTLKIRKLINIDSSAVDAFKSVEETLTLGYEFVEKSRGIL